MDALVEREPKGLLGRTHAEAPRSPMLRIPGGKIEGLRAKWPGAKKARHSLPRARFSAGVADPMMLDASSGDGRINWGNVRGGALTAILVIGAAALIWVINALSAAGSLFGPAAPLLLLL